MFDLKLCPSFEATSKLLGSLDNVFVGHIPTGVIGKEQLLAEVGKALEFPDYYGQNWDACDECIRDLEWIRQEIVILAHADVPTLTPRDLRIYSEVLESAIAEWKKMRGHRLFVTVG